MSRRKFKPNPRRTKTKAEQRSEYRKSLAQKPVSATTEEKERYDTDSTDFMPDSKISKPSIEKIAKPSKIKKIGLYLGIAVSVIVILSAAIGIGIKYNSITNSIDGFEEDLSDLRSSTETKINSMEKGLKSDLRLITERIDKYISNENSSLEE